MKQKAHAWVALRAFKLIDDLGSTPKLVELLSWYLSDAWEGAWLPDTLIVDMRYGHIFKMDSDPKEINEKIGDRYKLSFKDLNKKLKGKRLCLNYIKGLDELNKPYKAPEKGGHLPHRVIALSHSIGDMLKLSDFPLALYSKKKIPKAYKNDLSAQNIEALSRSPNFSARQIALSFFLLSHYICDAHMPLHCDFRDFSKKGKKRRVSKKLHPSIEKKWESFFPDKEVLTLHKYSKISIDKAVAKLPENSMIEIDKTKKYNLSTTKRQLLSIRHNEEREMNFVTRVSYGVSRKWINERFEDVDALIEKNPEEFKEVTNFIFHDAVECVARVWLKAWGRFIG